MQAPEIVVVQALADKDNATSDNHKHLWPNVAALWRALASHIAL